MNIFFLDEDEKKCAQMHVDRHVCKMVIEYAQLLSTAHRVLDGQEYRRLSANNRSIKAWRLPDSRSSRPSGNRQALIDRLLADNLLYS